MKLISEKIGVAVLWLLAGLSTVRGDEKMVPLTTALSSTVISGYINTSIQWNPPLYSGASLPTPNPTFQFPYPFAGSRHGIHYQVYLTKPGISLRIVSLGEASPKDLRALYYQALRQGWVVTIFPLYY